MTTQQVGIREESIRLIAHALERADQNKVFDMRQKSGRLEITVRLGTEDEYMAEAEHLLDHEIYRTAEKRILARIGGDL